MRKSNKAEQWARRKAELAAQKPSDLVVRKATKEELKFDRKGRKGSVTSHYAGRRHEPGDKQWMRTMNGKWKEVVVYKGGEGGRGWTVRSTLI